MPVYVYDPIRVTAMPTFRVHAMLDRSLIPWPASPKKQFVDALLGQLVR